MPRNRDTAQTRDDRAALIDAALGACLQTLFASDEFNHLGREACTHEARTALTRRVLGRLLLSALAVPKGLAPERWQALAAQLAEPETWPRVPGWEPAVHDAALTVAAARLPRIEAAQLGPTYERWLRTLPQVEPASGEVTLETLALRRKAGGCFYTPPRLAAELCTETLAPCLPKDTSQEPSALRIVDPSCGTGAFLLCALEVLVPDARDTSSRLAAVQHSLYGVDVDALAVGVARVLLAHAVLDPPGASVAPAELEALSTALHSHLRSGDALLGRAFCDSDASTAEGAAPQCDGEPTALDWSDAFPEVAQAGGFDAVLGNPPWDKVKPLAREFFAERLPQLRTLNRRAFDAELERLLGEQPQLAAAWQAHQRSAKAYAAALRTRYERLGRGDTNLYKAFLARAFEVLAPAGRLGMVLPYSICIDLGASELRRQALTEHGPLHITRYGSGEATFGITNVVNFVTLRACGGGPTASPRGERDVVYTRCVDGPEIAIPRCLVERISPSSYSLPELNAPEEVPRLERLYEGAPLLGASPAGHTAPSGVLRVRWQRELDMTLDRKLFNTVSEGMPVFEGKMIHQYRPNWAGTAEGGAHARERVTWIKEDPPLDARGLPLPRYWVREAELFGAKSDEDRPGYRCAVRLIQNSRNRRVLIATLLPPGVIAGNSLATARIEPADGDFCEVARLRDHLFLCGWLNDEELDWLIRLKIDANLNLFHLKQLPLPRPFAAKPNGAPLDAAAYEEAHQRYGIHALSRLLQAAPQVYEPLRNQVLAPDDAWAHAAQAALAPLCS